MTQIFNRSSDNEKRRRLRRATGSANSAWAEAAQSSTPGLSISPTVPPRPMAL